MSLVLNDEEYVATGKNSEMSAGINTMFLKPTKPDSSSKEERELFERAGDHSPADKRGGVMMKRQKPSRKTKNYSHR